MTTAERSIFVGHPYKKFNTDDFRSTLNKNRRRHSCKFEFADEKITSDFLLDKLSNMIENSAFCIFDITNWNPNVTLELGIARGLKKRFYIVQDTTRKKSPDAPSDIKGLDRVDYSSLLDLQAKIQIMLEREFPIAIQTVDTVYKTCVDEITQIVTSNPGVSRGNIATRIKRDREFVSKILQSMLANGEVKKAGSKKGTRYYLGGADLRSYRSGRKKTGTKRRS